ncbi:MAG: DUF6326 family protein [Sandaracinaceae bacterium]
MTLETPSPRALLSTLWVMLMINMIYNDIFSLVLAHAGLLEMDIPGDPRLMMALAGVLTNIPIVMILVSRHAAYRLNRRLNVAAVVFTLLYIVGGGDTAPHYLVVAAIEAVILAGILVTALRWKGPARAG